MLHTARQRSLRRLSNFGSKGSRTRGPPDYRTLTEPPGAPNAAGYVA